MRSKRSREGEIVIDHRASPGLTPAQVAGFAPAVAKGELYESAVVVCGHCDAAVILEPKRTRDRGWCPKCDRYTCDDCEAQRARDGECRSVERRADAYLNHIERGGSSSLLFTR